MLECCADQKSFVENSRRIDLIIVNVCDKREKTVLNLQSENLYVMSYQITA